MVITFASGLAPKWFISIALALICVSVSPIIREKERFILYVSVLVLPISFDFYLIHLKGLPYSLPISGLRVTAFDFFFFFLLISWIFRLATARLIQIRLYPYVSIPFALLLIISLFASVSSPIPGVIRVSYLWYALQSWLIFLYIANNIRDRRTILIVVSLFLISGVIQSFLAMAQYATGGTLGLDLIGETEKGYFAMKAGAGTVNRVAGTFGHPNKLGMFLGMMLPVNLALILAPIPMRFKCMLIPSFILISIADILTFSRGAWLSLSIGASITLYWCIAKRTGSKILSGFLITALLALAFLVAVTQVDPVKKRLFESDYGTAHIRVPLAKLALNMIRHNPFLGVGPGNFTAVAHKYDTTRERVSYAFPAPVHNTFLLMAAELGIPALGFFLIIIGYMFINILRTAKSRADPIISYLGVGFFGAWTCWAVHQLLDYQYILLTSNAFWFNLGLLLATAQIGTRALPPEVKNIPKD
jgi:O-antigen ligase